jgi:hypothetical protein
MITDHSKEECLKFMQPGFRMIFDRQALDAAMDAASKAA